MKVAIVGNSNSIIRSSFSLFLKSKTEIEIFQGSIGETPSIFLLEFIARHASLDADALVVETFVVDAQWVRMNRIDRGQIRHNLNLFLARVRQTSTCRVILVVLPIRSLLMTEEKLWIEDVAEEMAALHDVDLLNIYALLRSLFGSSWTGLPAGAELRTQELLRSVGLPYGDWPGYLWITGLRVPSSAIGPLLRHAFQDELHIGEAVQALIADILEMWLKSPRGERRPPTFLHSGGQQKIIAVSATGAGPGVIHRSSSILERDFTIIDRSNPAVFKVPKNHHAIGLLVNRSKCFGFLTLSSQAESITYDMRLAPYGPWQFLAGVLPIPKDIGDGDLVISISGGADAEQVGQTYWNTTTSDRDITAEVGDLVLVDRDWEARAHEASQTSVSVAKPGIETLPWARKCINDFVSVANLGAASVESAAIFGLRQMLNSAIERAGGDAAIDRARLFIALGDFKAATAELDNLRDSDESRRQQAEGILKKVKDFQENVQ